MRKQKEWHLATAHEEILENPKVRAIADRLQCTPVTAMLLLHRGCETPEDAESFIYEEKEEMHNPFHLQDMEKAVGRILEAVENGECIVIYGDYDVDGVTSVSMLYLYLQSLGAKVSYYIPCRTGEGYGVSENALRKLADEGAKLVITVDTGITAAAEVELARELHMDMIVTDHHECCGVLPDAVAVVNPKRPDCTYPFKELAGVGVVFKLVCAVELARNVDKVPIEETMWSMIRRFSDLAAVGTVADVMPLRDENRLMVRLGIQMMEKNPRPGLEELLEATQSDSRYSAKRKITATLIGFTIAPRINAAGRLRDASLAVELFLAPDCESAAPIAQQLCDINKERQTQENAIIEEAYRQIAEAHDFDAEPVLVLTSETWQHGIIGIVASRLTEKYNCPTILISFEGTENVHDPQMEAYGEAVGKGSGRSIKGMNLVAALGACEDLLVKYGGHELAAGLSIRRENVDAFRKRINAYARTALKDVDREPVLEAECELTAEEITMEQAQELYELEPFGVSNPVPVFYSTGMTVQEVQGVGGNKHTRLRFHLPQRGNVNAICFRRDPSSMNLFPGDKVDVLYALDINVFQGNRSLQMVVKDIRLCERELRKQDEEETLYTEISRAFNSGSEEAGVALTYVQVRRYIPTREDFAAAYQLMRRELRMEHQMFSYRAFQHLLHLSYPNHEFSSLMLRLILRVLTELHLVGAEPLEKEGFLLRQIPVSPKTSLENAPFYKYLLVTYLGETGGQTEEEKHS